jgi:hypothetical protein
MRNIGIVFLTVLGLFVGGCGKSEIDLSKESGKFVDPSKFGDNVSAEVKGRAIALKALIEADPLYEEWRQFDQLTKTFRNDYRYLAGVFRKIAPIMEKWDKHYKTTELDELYQHCLRCSAKGLKGVGDYECLHKKFNQMRDHLHWRIGMTIASNHCPVLHGRYDDVKQLKSKYGLECSREGQASSLSWHQISFAAAKTALNYLKSPSFTVTFDDDGNLVHGVSFTLNGDDYKAAQAGQTPEQKWDFNVAYDRAKIRNRPPFVDELIRLEFPSDSIAIIAELDRIATTLPPQAKKSLQFVDFSTKANGHAIYVCCTHGGDNYAPVTVTVVEKQTADTLNAAWELLSP